MENILYNVLVVFMFLNLILGFLFLFYHLFYAPHSLTFQTWFLWNAALQEERFFFVPIFRNFFQFFNY